MKKVLRLVLGSCVFLVLLLVALRLMAVIREGTTSSIPPPEGQMIETTMGAVYIEQMGKGPAVLLIHGSVGWSGFWRETSQALAANGYRAIAMDLSPMGYSEADPDGGYTRVTQAQRILALVEAMSLRPALLAHSFGAGPGLEAVMRAPQEWCGAVVVAGALGVGGDPSTRLPLPLRPRWLREVLVSASVTNPWALGPLLRQFLHQKHRAAPYLDVLWQPMRQPGTTAKIAEWLPTLFLPPIGAMSIDPASYGALKTPLALIWGAQDRATPLEQGQWLAKTVPGAQLTVLPDLGHIPQIEDVVAFQTALFDSLEHAAKDCTD